MHGDADADILVDDAVGDVAGVGGGAHGRRCHGVHACGVAEGGGGCPAEGVVAGTASGDGVQCGGAAIANLVLVGGGGGGEVRAVHADGDVGRAGAAALGVGDGDGIGLRLNQRDGLCGLAVGVGHHIGGFPVVGEVAFGTRVDGDGGSL